MKKCILWLFFFAAIVPSFLSCHSQLHVNRLKSEKVKIAPDQWKVVVINRFNPDFLPFDKENKIKVFAEGAMEAFYGAVDAILEDSTYFLVHADSINYRAEKPNTGLAESQLSTIYQQHPFHLLLSLDRFNVGLEQETLRIENEDGFVSKIAYFTLVTTSNWTLYDSLGNVLDQVSLSLDELYQSRSVVSGLPAIVPSIGKVGEQVNELAYFTGYDYWKRLYPQPLSYMRPYFSMGKLKPAASKMATNDWEEAIELLKPIAEGRNIRAGKAAFNLAVAYEAMGLIDEAKFWATKASRRGISLAFLLLKDLEKY